MLSPKKMSKVLIVGNKERLEDTINALYDLKIIHIIDYNDKEEGFERGKPSKMSSIFSEYVLSLRALKDILHITSKESKSEIKDIEFSIEFKKRLESIENKVMEKRKKIDDIEVLLSDIEHISDVNDLVKMDLSPNVKEIMIDLVKSKDRLMQERNDLTEELHKINKEYRDFISTAEEFLSREIEKSETPLRLATTEHTYILEGWMQTDDVEKTKKTLERVTGGDAQIIEIEEEGLEDVPVYVETPEPFKPFETLVDMFSTPNYHEISPTLLISFTFPLFYGIMLGDLGYGLSLLLLVAYLRRRMKTVGWQSLLNILNYASIYTMIFGIVYGEFFGFEMYHDFFGISEIGGIHMPLVHRLEEIVPLLVASAAIGVVHITIGYIIGFINVLRNKGLKHAILEKVSWIGILYCLMGMVVFPDMIYPLLGGLAFFIVLMVMGEGALALIEIFTLISNVISYTRLLAIGLSSVGIAMAINKIVTDVLIPKGILGIILGVLMLVFGHTLNLALGIIASFLHSIRLQYVEFFTKFFKGGGIKFTPLGIRHKEV
ncbi:MAG: V-type ATP synthase subunit I [Candidatus Methanofastidiosa archaeon]|nr:V-type ATP synthase subunit I [Candidatus Methanofastidiosa archaeon]